MSTVQTSDLLDKIRTRGFWKVVIRPGRFVRDRVDYGDLYGIVDRNSVRLRGRDFPHVDHVQEPIRGDDWVGQESQSRDGLEVWRFYQSGQFIDYLGLFDDWRDQSDLRPGKRAWPPGTTLGVVRTIYSLTEFFEFAKRLSSTAAGDESMRIELALNGLGGRRLVTSVPGRFLSPDKPEEDSFSEGPIDTTPMELLVDARDMALRTARKLFQRFGWDPSIALLRDWRSTAEKDWKNWADKGQL